MSKDIKNEEAMLLDGLAAIKDYAKLNADMLTREDIAGFFKGIELDQAKFGMIEGYLMSNGIKIEGLDAKDNAYAKSVLEEEKAIIEKVAEENDTKAGNTLKEADYTEDEAMYKDYLEELNAIEKLSDHDKADCLTKIFNENDEDALIRLETELMKETPSMIEEFKNKGILTSDLIQEANLAMIAYVTNMNYVRDHDKQAAIKSEELESILGVYQEMLDEIKSDVSASINIMIDEQMDVFKVNGKIVNRVNMVNDSAKDLKEELVRKPTVAEVAEKTGLSEEEVIDTIKFSAKKIEDIDLKGIKI